MHVQRAMFTDTEIVAATAGMPAEPSGLKEEHQSKTILNTVKIYIKISNFVRKLFKKSVLIKRKLPPKSKIFEFLYSLFFFEDVNLSSFCLPWDLNHSSFYPSRDVNLSSFYPPGDVNLSSLCPSWDLTMSYFRVTHFSCICY